MHPSRRPTTRLAAEVLEDRSTPAVFTVTNVNDGGPGSLRDAVVLAEADAAADTIVFAPSLAGATIGLSTVGDTGLGPTGLLVTTPVTIRGNGQTISRAAAAPAFRLFTVGATGALTLEGLTLTGGLAVGGSSGSGGGGAGLGGAVFNQGTLQIINCTLTGNEARGGGSDAQTTVTGGGGLAGGPDAAGNGGPPNGGTTGGAGGFGGGGGTGTTAGGAGGFGGGGGTATDAGGVGGVGGFGGGGGAGETQGTGGFGGGVAFGGFGGGGAGMGGAVFNHGGSVLIANSTLTANTAVGGIAAAFFKRQGFNGSAYGGAVFNLNGQVTLTNDTFAGNVVTSGEGLFAGFPGAEEGGAVYNLSLAAPAFPGGPPATPTQTATVTVANTILANSTGGFMGTVSDLVNNQVDGTATIQATGPNLVSVAVVNTGGTVAGTPFVVAAPALGPLASNGGPTQTMLPQTGSPAIGAGSAAVLTPANFGGVPAYDQRGVGFARAVRGRVDLGAVQTQPVPPLAVSGSPGGAASLYAPDATGNYGSPAAAVAPFAGFGGNVRTAVADGDGDGVEDTVLVTGPGTPIRVAVVSGADNATLLVAPFDPFGGDFAGGRFVASADLDRDGRAEFVVTPDQGGGPRVTIFSLVNGTAAVRANFLGIDDINFRGGVRAALGDVSGDGVPDLAAAAGFGGGPRVALFDGATVLGGGPVRLVGDFFAFPGSDAANLRNGAFVAAGDVTGDGAADLIFGGGPGGAPRIFILSGATVAAGNVAGAQATPIGNFFVAGNVSDRGGVRVAAVNADADGRADVATGSGEGDAARVRVYPGKNFTTSGEPSTFQDLIPFGGSVLPGGVFVG